MTTMPDRELHELLPWYMSGTLNPEEARTFRAHLDGCAPCRAEIELLEGTRRQIAEHGDAMLEDHPPVETLVATARGEQDGEKAESVRRHLALCPDCALEASWARDEAVAGTEPIAPVQRAWWSSPAWGWAAAAAVVLLALILPRGGGVELKTGVVEPPVVIEGPERGTRAAAVVELRRGSVRRLLVYTNLRPDAFPITVEIVDQAGRPVSTDAKLGERWELEGYVSMHLVARDLETGDYTIRIREATQTVREFPLRIVLR